jgi:hypothetical protein
VQFGVQVGGERITFGQFGLRAVGELAFFLRDPRTLAVALAGD